MAREYVSRMDSAADAALLRHAGLGEANPNPNPKPNPKSNPKPKPKPKPNQVRLTATGALVGPLIGLLIAAHGSRVKRLAREQHAQLARTTARAAETLGAVRPIKACGNPWNLTLTLT